MNYKYSFLLFLIIMFSMNCFSLQLRYYENPEGTVITSVNDLDWNEALASYQGRTFPLPEYIPEYINQDLIRTNISDSLYKYVTGRAVPRYFDGEKYTNLKYIGYNPKNLTDLQENQLDQWQIIINSHKDTDKKCVYSAYIEWTKNFGNPNLQEQDKNVNRTIYTQSIYYDLGYWYVPQIRNAFEKDCYYLFKNNHGTNKVGYNKYQYYNYNTDLGMVFYDTYAEALCDPETKGFIYPEFIKETNTSSDVDFSILLYENLLKTNKSRIYSGGTCLYYSSSFNDYYVVDCYSRDKVIENTKLKDEWMMKVLKGKYIPEYISYKGLTGAKSIYDYFYNSNSDVRRCEQITTFLPFVVINNFINNLYNFDLKGIILGQPVKTVFESYKCTNDIFNAIRIQLGINEKWDQEGVQQIIWDYYKREFNIEKGTNLFPININYAGIRCSENSTFKGSSVSPINPYAQTQYVECNWTNNDPEIVKVSYRFNQLMNPIFGLIAGSATKYEAYNTEQFMNNVKEMLLYTNNISNVKTTVINGSNSVEYTSTFSINRSKLDGCTFVFFNENQAKLADQNANEVLATIEKGTTELPIEVPKAQKVAIELLKSDVDKANIFYVFTVFAKVIFRGFVLYYYVLAILMFIYLIKLFIMLPSHIIDTIRMLGKSKYQRLKTGGILNKK